MKCELSVVVVALGLASGALAQNAVQWGVEFGGNGHWYARIPTPSGVSWSIAEATATAGGGHLVSITSPAENALLVSLGAQAGDLLGASAPQGQGCTPAAWSWHSGEPWSYTNWAQYEPSLHCEETVLVFASNQFPKWNNFYGGQGGYWIEWSADCNSDGVVDFGQIRQGSLADSNANNIPDCCEESAQCPLAALEWSLSSGGNGHWYALKRVFPSQSPESLFTLAADLGGHAATIASAAENEFCRQFVVPWEGTLIGLRKLQGTNQVAWITGEPVTYINWNSGEGSNIGERYALIQPASGRWHDTDLTRRQVVLVEFDADCNSDGVVDFGQIRQGSLADSNANNIPDCCEGGSSCSQCPADVVEDGVVNGVDLAAVVNAWGTDGGKLARSDVDGNGQVDAVDLAAILSAWGPCQP